MPLAARAALLRPTPCRALYTARDAIDYALRRFHEPWVRYRTLTPTLYGISDEPRSVYLTLGRTRARFGLSWRTVDAALEALGVDLALDGHLLAAPAVGGADGDLRALFGLQGHHHGERHYGALDLATLTPFEGAFQSEVDVPPARWRDAWLQAASNSGVL